MTNKTLNKDVSPTPIIISIPKCGTHLLKQILKGVPCFPKGKWISQNIPIIPQIDSCSPGTIMVGHLYYNQELHDYLNKHSIPRFFIYRDPRDMVVSYAFYAKDIAPGGHELRKYFLEVLKTDKERIMKLVTGFHWEGDGIKLNYGDVKRHYFPFLQWMKDPNTLVIRFEDLVENPQKRRLQITRMVDYLWDQISPFEKDKQSVIAAMENNINPKTSETFRRGKIGDWKNYFTEKDKEVFKEIAGEFLIDLGYEKDLNW